jgi:hypothetical protein
MGCCVCSGNCNHTGSCNYCKMHQGQKVPQVNFPTVCPTCGRCPTCGKGNHPVIWPNQPMPVYPWYTTGPVISCSCS